MSNSSSDRALRFALVAHDARKDEIVRWVGLHRDALSSVEIHSTGTTGGRIADAYPDLDVTRLKSGPLGGDQQIGAMICEQRLDALIFFVDPLLPMPHDVDVKARVVSTRLKLPRLSRQSECLDRRAHGKRLMRARLL